MEIDVSSAAWTSAAAEWLIVGVAEHQEFTASLGSLDAAMGGLLARLREAGDFNGKAAELLPLRGISGLAATRLLLVGLGPVDRFSEPVWNKSILSALRQVTGKERQTVAIAVPSLGAGADLVRSAAAAAVQAGAGQDLYKSERQRFPLDRATLLIGDATGDGDLAAAAEAGQILGEAVNLTRELVNEPPQAIYPVSFAERAEKVAAECGLECTMLDEAAMRGERMGSLLAVAQGSLQPPRLVVLEYKGAAADAPVLAICGKGVTFDSGGLSLKTNEGMLTMKCDMAGAATVLGTMQAIARLKLPVNVTGYMGLVENMPSGSSFKLGDVLKARNGVTIEVHNTDAEGRLVLADVLSYAVDRGASHVVDLATLTGACVVALGEEVVGAFTNNQAWCDRLLEAARKCGEDAWQLPMHELFAELIKSDVADIKNVGGRWGGAITAAKFLERFVGEKPWVHLDIAGPAFAASSKAHREGGATGCMVRTLVELARSYPPA